MKTWEMLKEFTESKQQNKVKAKVLNKKLREDKYCEYDFISMIDGVFYWNNDLTKGFRLNDIYDVLDLDWEIIS